MLRPWSSFWYPRPACCCREKMVDTMFQRYGFAGVQVQIQAVLSLYSQGKIICMPSPRKPSPVAYGISPGASYQASLSML